MQSLAMTSSPEYKGTLMRKPVSWTDFQRRYLSKEDGFKYEWLNGTIEKTKRSMDKTQLYILRNLQNYFMALRAAGKITGNLIPEPDLFFANNHRRPDVAWLTDEQIDRLAYDSREVPAFVIEIISTHDQINRVELKMDDYRAAGVQVVWLVFPATEKVHVYTGTGLARMSVVTGEQPCTAAPAVAHFEMPANVLLKKPVIAL